MDIVPLLLCVLLWIPIQFGIWLIHVRSFAWVRIVLRVYCACAAAIGLFLGLWWYPNQFPLLGGLRGWTVAILSGSAVFLLALAVMSHRMRDRIALRDATIQLAYFLIPVGLFEEIWFRGVWFAAFDGSFTGGVMLGSVVFALVHYNPRVRRIGPLDLANIAAIGLVFGAARYAGAGLIPLAAVHGVLDFISLYLLSNKRPRHRPVTAMAVFVGGSLVLAVALMLLGP